VIGSALNLNIHFHTLWLDGVYEEHIEQPQRKPRLHRSRAPTSAQLTQLAGTIESPRHWWRLLTLSFAATEVRSLASARLQHSRSLMTALRR